MTGIIGVFFQLAGIIGAIRFGETGIVVGQAAVPAGFEEGAEIGAPVRRGLPAQMESVA